MKKTVIISSIILILLGIGVLIYLLFFFEDDPEARERRAGFFDFFSRETDQEEVRKVEEEPIDTSTKEERQYHEWERAREAGLWPVSDLPVAFGRPLIEEDNGELYLYLVEKSQGDVYKTNALDSSEPEKLTSAMELPPIYESFWLSSREVLVRLQDHGGIETVRIRLPEEETATESLTFIFSNIDQLVVNPKQTRIFSLINGLGRVSSPIGENQQAIFKSALSQWQIDWPNENIITLTTAPAGGRDGFLLFLHPATGRQTVELQNLTGLSALTDPYLNYILYSTGRTDQLDTYIRNRDTQSDISLNISTLPEKCVWSQLERSIIYCAVPDRRPAGTYPDHWYQGKIQFSDTIWRIEAGTGLAEEINADLEGIDAVNLTLGPNENYLFFINRSDYKLWTLAL